MSIQQALPFGAEEASTCRLIEELGKVCGELPLEEKILVAPSLMIGHQLVERLALSGIPWMNLRVETVWNLAHGWIGPELARGGFRLLSRAQALALVEQACAEVLRDGSYFGSLRDRPGLHRALQRSLDELRGAGLTPATLPDSAFTDRRKASELREILRRYETSLAEGRFVDRPELLRRATEALASKTGSAAIYLLPDASDLSGLERRFLDGLSAGRVRLLACDPTTEWTGVARSARIFRALGEENEVREVFRRLLAQGIPFDRAELLHTDSSAYPPLVYELAAEHGIPCTYGGGIAASFTRPGRSALAFLDWIEREFEADMLRQALASGVLTLQRMAPSDASRLAVARALRDAGIGWGRERHLACLDRTIRELAAPHDRKAAEDPVDQARRDAFRARRAAAVRVARRFIARALELAPAEENGRIEMQALARGVREFVEQFARVAGELDGTASAALQKLFAELEMLPSVRLSPERAAGRLAEAVRALHIAADRPRPGRLHVAEYRSGGWSGRAQTFLIGLDDSKHPGVERQDPVLLDDERRGINRVVAPVELALGRDKPSEKTRALQACLARLRGELTVGFSCWNVANLAQPGDRFPSPFLLELYRVAAGKPAADYSQLDRELPRPAGFVPGERVALDEIEWWLSRLESSRAGGDAALLVRGFYPWLADGHRAEQLRDSPRFTEWDGHVGADPMLDPRISREPMSCSRIQAIGSCQYMYFLQYVLQVRPPDEIERDPTRWLDPMESGSLLHDVFRRFFEEMPSEDKRPNFDRDMGSLETVAHEEIARWRARIPPPSELAFGTQRDELLFACRTFLKIEEAHCAEAGVTPRFFEVPFGMRPESSSPIASPEAVEIPLAPRGSFLLRGSIDRIDQAADGSYHVWDYKTGNPYPYREELGLNGGRQVQYALYAMALEELLRRSGRLGAVKQSGYFFPGRKGQGQRFLRPLEPEETRTVLNSLFDTIAEGSFAHTTNPDDCRFCVYEAVCGGVDRATERAKGKDPELAPPALRAFWQRYGPKADS
ncbi:MAG: PD-(D/E)XK nuclease family protein [Thermoanaerobaculia bacterium]